MIGRVWEMLGLQTKRVAPVIDFASLASNTVEEISGVNLQPRLGGRNLEGAARMRLVRLRR